jgi:hypothetical protein
MNEKKIVGSRELILDLLEKNEGQISVDEIREFAIGKIGNYQLMGVFIPTTVAGKLSYNSIEEELQELRIIGKINISEGIVTLRENKETRTK